MTEVWCRTCSCFIVPLQLFIFKEENDDGETGLARHVSLQLLHLRRNHQVYRFMGCDCHIDLAIKRWKSVLDVDALRAKAHSPLAEVWLHGKVVSVD